MKSLIASLALIISPLSFSCTEDGQGGFMPENDMYISADAKVRNDMTEEKFNAIIDKVITPYKSIVAKKLGILKVSRKWKDGTVNASAMRLGPVWLVNMYGGLARHQYVTDDAFALVVCHELGHHLGGAPKVSMIINRWATNEGQADYFGAMKCFRRVFMNDDNQKIISTMNVPSLVQNQCEKSFSSENEIALCIRTAMAGKSLALLLGSGRSISFKTPDTSVVERTYNRHPQAQCRLDTYYQGALCDRDIDEKVSNRDPNKGVCTRRSNYETGIRPLCWYKPKS